MEYNGSHKISHETKDNSIIKKLIEKFGYNPNEDDPFYLARERWRSRRLDERSRIIPDRGGRCASADRE